MTKIAPVTRRAHFSNWTSFLNALLTHCAPKRDQHREDEHRHAGSRPVCGGQQYARSIFAASGSRLPKKRAADTGQKESAKRIPSSPAPHGPDRPRRLPGFVLTQDVAKWNGSTPRRTTPTTIRTGPSSYGSYTWKARRTGRGWRRCLRSTARQAPRRRDSVPRCTATPSAAPSGGSRGLCQ